MIIRLFLVVLCWIVTLAHESRADDWPRWRGSDADGVWRETDVVDRFRDGQLSIRWRVPIGPGYSGPTVADGRVYVTDRVVKPVQQERILCFDATSGTQIWDYVYPCLYRGVGYTAGPRAAVTVDDGRAYALGTMGHLHCLDAVTGDLLWQRDLNTQYKIRMPIWGIAGAPLVYEDIVIVQIGGSDGACLVAFDKKDGEEIWRAMNDQASYSSPILIRQAGHDVAVCWTGDHVVGLNPEDGSVYWSYPFPPTRMVINIATPVVRDNRLFVTSFYDGSLMLRLREDTPGVELIWTKCGKDEKNTEALQSIISTPVMLGDYVYGVDSYGELRCLDANTGERVWEDLTATPRARWSNIHFVQNGDRTWMFNERGELIIGRLSPTGFREISRAKLLRPTRDQLNRRGGVCWAHPAFADRHVFARNDEELVCASLVGQTLRD